MSLVKIGIGVIVLGVVVLPFQIVTGACIGIVGIALSFMGSMQRNSADQSASPLDRVAMKDRSRLRPLVKVRDEIASLATGTDTDIDTMVIAREAVQEADRMIAEAIDLLSRRAMLRKSPGAEESIAKLDDALAAGETALRTLRDKLVSSESTEGEETTDELRETLSRVQALTNSVDEANEVFKEQTK